MWLVVLLPLGSAGSGKTWMDEQVDRCFNKKGKSADSSMAPYGAGAHSGRRDDLPTIRLRAYPIPPLLGLSVPGRIENCPMWERRDRWQ